MKTVIPARMMLRVSMVTVMVTVGTLLLATAFPADASFTQFKILERRGDLVVLSHDVGNQAAPYLYVEGDPRRHAEHPTTIYYRIDLSEPPPGISVDDMEAAIESAVDTFNAVTCGRNVQLVRLPSAPGEDLGAAQHALGWGGQADDFAADITFAGWVPQGFFDEIGFGPSNGLAVPVAFDADGQSLVWGLDVFDPSREFSDVDANGKIDLYATEIYFNADSNYVLDDPERANTLFYIDLESIVLHELGHGLGMDHFGRSEVILDEDFNFVDLVVNPNSVSLMNTANYFQTRELSGSDIASFCGIYASWGVGRNRN